MTWASPDWLLYQVVSLVDGVSNYITRCSLCLPCESIKFVVVVVVVVVVVKLWETLSHYMHTSNCSIAIFHIIHLFFSNV